MTTGDLDGRGEDNVVIAFGPPYGIYTWQNNAAWIPVHSISPEGMAVGTPRDP